MSHPGSLAQPGIRSHDDQGNGPTPHDSLSAHWKGIPISDLGSRRSSRTAVAIRDYPFPYRAAFALTNGTRATSSVSFRQIIDYLCGSAETEFGTGLGLELSFPLTISTEGRLSFGTAFNADGLEFVEDERAVVALARAGWLDTMRDAPASEAVRRKRDALARQGVQLAVEIGRRPTKAEARFYSHDGLLEDDKFGDHLDFRVSDRIQSAARSYDWEQWSDLGTLDPASVMSRFNQTLQPSDPERKAIGFKRFRGRLRPSATTFSSQVSSSRLDAIERQRGTVIVEQNLALWSLIGASEKSDGLRPAGSDIFDYHSIAAWQDLTTRSRDGRLLVAATKRLLHWLWLREHLDLHTTRGPDRWIITVQASQAGVGSHKTVRSELDGLALTIPEAAPECVVLFEGQRTLLNMRRAPDPSLPGRHVLHLPWSRPEWPGFDRAVTAFS